MASRLTVIDESNFARNQTELDILNQVHDEIVELRNILGGALVGSKTHDFASIAAGAEDSTTITVTGAAVGDLVLGSFGVDITGLMATWQVSAADTVKVEVSNVSAAAVDLASTTLRCIVFPKAAKAVAAKVLSLS